LGLDEPRHLRRPGVVDHLRIRAGLGTL
jgi:hypothetical protein